MPSKGSAQEEKDPPKHEIYQLRGEFQLMIEERQTSMMHAMRNMVAEFMRNNGRSEFSTAEGSAAVGKRPRGVELTVA